MVDDTSLAVHRAAVLVDAGRHPEALTLLAPHLGTGDLNVLLVAAKAELELKHYDDAERLAGQAVISAPEHLGALQALAEVLLERRRRKDARGVLTTMLRLAPDSAVPSSLWVLADMKVGMVDDTTEAHARRAVSLDSSNTAALQVLALVLFQRGGRQRLAEAQRITSMAALRDPSSDLTALTMAESAHKKSRNMVPTIRYGAGKLRSNPTRSSFTLLAGLARTLSMAFFAQALLALLAYRLGRVGESTSRAVGFSGAVTMVAAEALVIMGGWWFLHRLGPDRRLVVAAVKRSRPLLGALTLQFLILLLAISALFTGSQTTANLLFGIVLVAAAAVAVCVVTIRFHAIGTTSQR